MEKLSRKCKLIGLSALLCLALGVAVAKPGADFPIFTDVDSMLEYCSRADAQIDQVTKQHPSQGRCELRLTCGTGSISCHATHEQQ